METAGKIIAGIMAGCPAEIWTEFLKKLSQQNSETRDEQQVRHYNSAEGDLTGYDCELCKNKGRVAYLAGDRFSTRECSCMPLRIFSENMDKSGLKDLAKIFSFDNFKTEQEWQKTVKYRALKYVSDFEKENDALKWLFVFGAVGSGKTHICTAVCNKILENGGKVAYMMWREVSVQLKASINDDDEYKRIFKPYKDAETLYIDDFFKMKKGQNPTDADINLAFELINHRYCKPNSRTIISSEKSIDDIIEFDEAVGSRISQRCGEYYRIKINPGEGKNIRLQV